ncbi:hypothetical protein MJO28_010542 [Puccinia striiformis f. sp. tritici]|uniref:G-patch domain-containing protein n=3 Tax=Puccinia striiformis TaxID=27350 RepID=A0A0L0USZ6_9BASI|nr:hypothetical protein Pst134EB_020239 [Puccinia striiformis f. sp. tritici]KAI9613998.1 hypothetical protein H4Q26_009852 [Puccinia striiformis f. sp. tritici PST-130]KNE90135.1 hypothetical protein PSTG_16409 [Puccinia striiformis f. sp. tritici PST-78]POW18428.1 hypothetical protein PSHT_05835 [Puccinia striiformis]KAI7944847.1 hypothetical protein MJO28_010542 [Puccinia striiformis f. sp. tritici]
MGLSGRKEKQKIGEDPRNTKWAKNEANPGFKILSSMGWSPSTTSLGAAASTSEPVVSSWKRLPGSILPVIKSSTSGLGANPAQASTSTYLSGAPRFVRGSQAPSAVEPNGEPSSVIVEDDPERSNKIAIVSQGGGFDDLLSRLNQSKPKTVTITSIEDESGEESFVVVLDQPTKLKKTKSGSKKEKTLKSEKKKRVRILELCSANKSSSDSLQDKLIEDDDQQPKKKKSKKNSERSEDEPSEKEKKLKRKSKKSEKPKTALAAPSLLITNPDQIIANGDEDLVVTPSGPIRISRPINPRVAARAKFIRSKKLASSASNAQAMAEILGIPPPE